MTLPRIGDEVLVAYLAGDPDQPIVVGRVHDATARPPLDLPEPDRTVSVWRSRTIGGDGYNLVLMDDAPGGERLWLRAERDYRLHVQRNASTLIESDSKVVVREDASVEVDGHLAVDSGSFEHVSGPYAVRATEKAVAIRDGLDVTADTIRIEAGSRIELVCAGTKLVLTPGGATLEGGKATIRGGNIDIKADGTVDVDGALITLN
jgi:type VI secretion system secreted protein VgrG